MYSVRLRELFNYYHMNDLDRMRHEYEKRERHFLNDDRYSLLNPAYRQPAGLHLDRIQVWLAIPTLASAHLCHSASQLWAGLSGWPCEICQSLG
jgi:hypothetical protein